MNWIRKKLLQFYYGPAFPFFIFMLMMFLAHRFMYTNYGDDAAYNETLTTTLKDKSMWEVIQYGYTVGKKIFIRYPYSVFYYFIRKFCGGVFWRPCIALCYPVIAASIAVIFGRNWEQGRAEASASSAERGAQAAERDGRIAGQGAQNAGQGTQVAERDARISERSTQAAKRSMHVVANSTMKNESRGSLAAARGWMVMACCVVLLTPIAVMSETGWLSTSNVYVLPAAVCMVSCIGVRDAFYHEKRSWIIYILNGAVLYIGTAHEQLAALMFGLLLVLVVWKIVTEKKVNWILVLYLFIAAVQTYRSLTWPGNADRRYGEAIRFFPDFFSLDILDKIYLGYIETMKIVMTVYMVPLTILAVLAAVLIWIRYAEKLYRAISMIPVTIMLIYGIRPPFLSKISSDIVLYTLDEKININNFYNIQLSVGLFLSLVLVGCLLLCIYLAFGNTFESCFYCFLLLGGFCTRYIMGLSASLYASGSRTTFVLFVCIAIIIFSMLKKLSTLISEKRMGYARMAMCVTALVSYFNLLAFI